MIAVMVSVLPVLLFLGALILIDSYKLVSLKSVLLTIGVGALAAWASLGVTTAILAWTNLDRDVYARYAAPVVEETLKAGYAVYLIRSKRVGFMVDAAICGFAVGAGFALIENVYYLGALEETSILLWIVRGFGTAVMHGGTTAVFAILAKNLTDRFPGRGLLVLPPALLLAALTHAVFNHFFLPPILETVLVLTVLPALLYVVFKQSEEATREWLGVGLDADLELLELITTGNLSASPIGAYLHSLREKFPVEAIVDMLCLLRLHTELALRAKGILMMRAMGFASDNDPEIVEKFNELRYLEKSIGPTGKIAIAPFLRTTSRDLWQIYMLQS
jgi:RsiW-degrading membrane proteinase PrsW (M82 family)